MNSPALYALAGIALFGIGFYSVVVHAHRLRKVLAVLLILPGVILLSSR